MGELFDRYVAVDWSAAARPVTGPNSIWIAVTSDDPRLEPRLSNPVTRRLAEHELTGLIASSGRTLLTVDASFGYPGGTAAWFGLAGDAPWRAMWSHLAAHLVDDESNVNNRFQVAAALNERRSGPGPFWGRPASQPLAGLGTRKPRAFPIPEYRTVEERLRAAGRRPASGWQLMGAGSVGGQTLTLLPMLHRLWCAGAVHAWPFTTGLRLPDDRRCVVAETWPTAFDLELSTDGPVAGRAVRDAAQVDGVVRRLRAADADGALAGWFAPELDPAERSIVESEEGWALLPPAAFRTGPVA